MATDDDASSSGGGRRNYDVFLSFRGADTRKIFVGHLYSALLCKALTTFKDTEELGKGDVLWGLVKAIEVSKVAVVVLSENFAYSKWCMIELAKIMECVNAEKLIVVPIFYQVDPADVKHVRTTFKDAFAKHVHQARETKTELRRWEKALKEVGHLSGWDSREYKDEAKLIEEVAEDVFKKVMNTRPRKSNDLVGMDSHIRKMKYRLRPNQPGDDVHVSGIWGMGGIGKTTLARAVYDEMCGEFKCHVFLDDVKKGFKRKTEAEMQEDLLFRILNVNVRNYNSSTIIEKLSTMKLFLVLDDVDELSQIDALLGKQGSFGRGSRIIITTRDRSLLTLREFDVYELGFLQNHHALELFRKCAFRNIKPSSEYDPLIQPAVDYAQGLPLALKVLGTSLYKKTKWEWEAELKKIKKKQHLGIEAVLITSFEGLEHFQKMIFLDIACFFRGMRKGYAIEIMDACGFFPLCELPVLVDRALVTDYKTGYYSVVLEIHDLLVDMALGIVSGEVSLRRMSSADEIENVLTHNNADTKAVESIDLDLHHLTVLKINSEALASMTKLRLLRIHFNRTIDFVNDYHDSREELYNLRHECKQYVNGDLKFLSYELRCLIWHGFPLKSLPSDFRPKHLVDLDMRCSSVTQLWEGIQPLQKLKFMNFSRSPDLKETPDLTQAKTLEKVDLEGCTSLLVVHPSISELKNLVSLNLKDCKELRVLPCSFLTKSLQTLELSGCSKLENFPEIPEVIEKLSQLSLDDTAIRELPSSIINLTGLASLSLRNCRGFQGLPSTICRVKSLKYLILSGCSKFEVFPELSGASYMEELRELHLDETSIKEFLPASSALQKLLVLSLRDCKELKSLPHTINMVSLESFILSGCSNLEKFPEVSNNLWKLSELDLYDMAIPELPPSFKNLKCLTSLILTDCGSIRSLPSSIFHLQFLEKIIVSGCSKFEMFPEVEEDLVRLQYLVTLRIEDCTELKSIPCSICKLKSLRFLTLSGCSMFEVFPDISEDMEELRELHLDGTSIGKLYPSIDRLKRLVLLNMRNCRSLVFLPDSICNLSYLTGLTLSGCSNLHSLPRKLGKLKYLVDLKVEGSCIKQPSCQPSSSTNCLGGSLSKRLWSVFGPKCFAEKVSPERYFCIEQSGSDLRELRRTFDGLHYSERNILLDLSWFLRGTKLEYATKILHSCGFFPYSALRVLIDRSLVAISDKDGTLKIQIQETVNDVVRDNVREQNAHDPGGRTMIMSHQGINCLSSDYLATIAVEVMTFDLSESREVYYNAKAFVAMKKLRLLQIYNDGSSNCKQHVIGDFRFISHELRCLIWHRYPLKSLPSNFHPKNLVDLDMRFSRLELLWEGTKLLKNIAFINLSHSLYLEEVPDLTEAKNLEKLILDGCTSLSEVHTSIWDHKNLVVLSLKGCSGLKFLPRSIYLKSLQTLNLNGCSGLTKFPVISEVMTELSVLNLDETAIRKLPSSIERLQGLELLSLKNCTSLVSLPDSISSLAHLQQLYLDGCSKLSKFPEKLRNAQSLKISGMEELPRNREVDIDGITESSSESGDETGAKEETATEGSCSKSGAEGHNPRSSTQTTVNDEASTSVAGNATRRGERGLGGRGRGRGRGRGSSNGSGLEPPARKLINNNERGRERAINGVRGRSLTAARARGSQQATQLINTRRHVIEPSRQSEDPTSTQTNQITRTSLNEVRPQNTTQSTPWRS